MSSHDPGDDRLRAALAVAEEANRLKDECLAVLSDELRTPLNASGGADRVRAYGGPHDDGELICRPDSTHR